MASPSASSTARRFRRSRSTTPAWSASRIDIADQLPELLDLLELMTDVKLREFRIALGSPARQIKLWENLSIETMGPRMYRRYLVPVYHQIFDILEGTDKRLQVHYDGKLRVIADDIRRPALRRAGFVHAAAGGGHDDRGGARSSGPTSSCGSTPR